MTLTELRQKAQDYDNLQNEGGEGYNPYSEKIAELERQSVVRQPETREDQIDKLHDRVRIECGSVASESGFDVDQLRDELYAQIDAIESEIDSEFFAVWTKDETIRRQKAWGDRVAGGQFGQCGGGTVDFAALHKQYDTQGWTLDDLKKAVAKYELPKYVRTYELNHGTVEDVKNETDPESNVF